MTNWWFWSFSKSCDWITAGHLLTTIENFLIWAKSLWFKFIVAHAIFIGQRFVLWKKIYDKKLFLKITKLMQNVKRKTVSNMSSIKSRKKRSGFCICLCICICLPIKIRPRLLLIGNSSWLESWLLIWAKLAPLALQSVHMLRYLISPIKCFDLCGHFAGAMKLILCINANW